MVDRMWLLDYEFVVWSLPLLMAVVPKVIDFQLELFYLPLFQ